MSIRLGPEQLYEKCGLCHLFVFENLAYDEDDPDSADIAPYEHGSRGDEADEAIEATHEPVPSGLKATLDDWKAVGPPEMRARFVDEDHPEVPDAVGLQLLAKQRQQP